VTSEYAGRSTGGFKASAFLPLWARRVLRPLWRYVWILAWTIRLQWWKLTRNARLRRLYQTHDLIKVTLGTGTTIHPGWIDTDYKPLTGNILYLNATKRFPFADRSVDYFHTEHMIEHLPLMSAQFIFRECHRTLKPGGKIRIATPDVMNLVRLLTEPNDPASAEYATWALRLVPPRIEAGTPLTPGMVFNNFVRDWGHQFIYDQATLTVLLTKAGFVSVRRCEINQSDDQNLTALEQRDKAIGDVANQFETMVLEGTKPS
jgi:predicted SAM-dependent methyltransferase